ncbi:hypothetical protein CCAN2_1970028 [Capnocytophaga canimorsus]|nr:hypothetical protein CCAN2_1970028 [Capnocytophaga canimorsus]
MFQKIRGLFVYSDILYNFTFLIYYKLWVIKKTKLKGQACTKMSCMNSTKLPIK